MYMSKLSTLKTSHKIAAGLVGAALLVAAPAYAATSAGITLTGSVQQILNLTVTATTAASSLDLTAVASGLKIATVLSESNKTTGYAVSVSSANQAATQCTVTSGPCFYSPVGGGAGSNMPFTLSRNTVNVAFTGATGQFVSTTARSVLGGDAYDAKISYDGVSAALPQATNYTETLTFTISAP
jgi:hypothetical protein